MIGFLREVVPRKPRTARRMFRDRWAHPIHGCKHVFDANARQQTEYQTPGAKLRNRRIAWSLAANPGVGVNL